MQYEDLDMAECKNFIQEKFVGKLLAFLNGTGTRVCNNVEYMEVYQLIIH